MGGQYNITDTLFSILKRPADMNGTWNGSMVDEVDTACRAAMQLVQRKQRSSSWTETWTESESFEVVRKRWLQDLNGSSQQECELLAKRGRGAVHEKMKSMNKTDKAAMAYFKKNPETRKAGLAAIVRNLAAPGAKQRCVRSRDWHAFT